MGKLISDELSYMGKVITDELFYKTCHLQLFFLKTYWIFNLVWEKTFSSYERTSSVLGVNFQLFSEKVSSCSRRRPSASMKLFVEQFMFENLRISVNIFSSFGSRSTALLEKDLLFFSERISSSIESFELIKEKSRSRSSALLWGDVQLF